jgi:hypothetical protein
MMSLEHKRLRRLLFRVQGGIKYNQSGRLL